MSNKLQRIYLALGSNLGDRRAFLERAISALPPEVLPRKCSAVYETQPWGFEDQGQFLNLVLEARTALSPAELLNYLKSLEQKIGRKASFPNGPREIDIDILFYADQVIEQHGLSIPHSKIQERAFVLGPLADLAPELVHPSLGKSVTELMDSINMTGIQRLSEMEICTEITQDS